MTFTRWPSHWMAASWHRVVRITPLNSVTSPASRRSAPLGTGTACLEWYSHRKAACYTPVATIPLCVYGAFADETAFLSHRGMRAGLQYAC
jgi:hypothetical protein